MRCRCLTCAWIVAVLVLTQLAIAAEHAVRLDDAVAKPQLADKPDGISSGETTQLYRDICVLGHSGRSGDADQKKGWIGLRNARLLLKFSRESADWETFEVQGIPGDVIVPGRPRTALDFQIDGVRTIERYGAKLLRHSTSVDEKRSCASLHLTLGVAPLKKADDKNAVYEYELTATYTLYAGSGRIDRSLRLVRNGGAADAPAARKLEAFVFQIPSACLGDGADCAFDAPGPWVPRSYVRPAAPLVELRKDYLGIHGAPDGGFGLLALSNAKLNTTLASWLDTRGGEVSYSPGVRRDGPSRLTFDFFDRRAVRLKPGMTVESDMHQIEIVAGPLPAALAKYREMAQRAMPLEKETPAWVREVVLLEVYPPYFPGGLKEITRRLPFYRDVGFNAVYLMPHWLGSYSPIDVFKVDPKFGTPEDLKELVRTAHGLGMKVLFDMVIHGFNEKSPLVQERPELFIHDERGNVARHPTWKSMSTDWASPAYRRFMVDLVLHDLQEYDVDGYRVDAASYKAPNWSPDMPYPAYASGSAAPELMAIMLRAMRKKKKDAVLLSEVFGPVFYRVCNFGHDNQTEAPQHFIELLDKRQATAADYKAHMANVCDMLPAGANRVYYARNHDTSWFYHFNGYTPRFLALDAIHALCTIPEVFAGDPGHKPNPDDDPATFDYYRKLFAARKALPELARGELLLREVECGNPAVFTALRRLDGRTTLVAVSLSDREEEAVVTVPAALCAAQDNELRLLDPIGGGTTVVRLDEVDAKTLRYKVKLKPFQVSLGRL